MIFLGILFVLGVLLLVAHLQLCAEQKISDKKVMIELKNQVIDYIGNKIDVENIIMNTIHDIENKVCSNAKEMIIRQFIVENELSEEEKEYVPILFENFNEYLNEFINDIAGDLHVNCINFNSEHISQASDGYEDVCKIISDYVKENYNVDEWDYDFTDMSLEDFINEEYNPKAIKQEYSFYISDWGEYSDKFPFNEYLVKDLKTLYEYKKGKKDKKLVDDVTKKVTEIVNDKWNHFVDEETDKIKNEFFQLLDEAIEENF